MEKKKILVVEDSESISKVLKFRLEKNGFDVCQAFDGEEALAKAAECAPDLILLDHYMPRMNGDEVCRKLKSDGKLRAIPVIMCSAAADSLPDLSETGADGSLLKPYDPDKLIEVIRKHIV